MNFESEGAFRYWLKINGYTDDVINEMAYKWDSVTINNGQITDSVTQTLVNDQITDSITV
jgi:hypothetical protein